VRNAPRVLVIVAAGLAAGFLSSCGVTRAPVQKPAIEESQRHLQAGEYEQAIASCQSAYEQHPNKKSILAEYVRTLEGIKKTADVSLANRDYVAAERAYSALIDHFEDYKGLRESLTFTPADLGRLIRQCRARLTEARIERYLDAGDYENALGARRPLSPAEFKDPAVAAGLAGTMEEVRRRADAAAGRGDYSSAGRAYAALANHGSDAARLALRLSFSREVAKEGVKKCRAELTRRGLEQYRQGNLSKAIATWVDLLRFDPENPEIRKAVETARAQLKELQKK